MESKKRHRRTKAELMLDPEYCKKHGLPLPKPEKPAKKTWKKQQKAATPEPKKRHRRTKAELLKDPLYRKKHGLDAPKVTDLSKVDRVEKPRKPRKSSLTGNQAIAEIEGRWMAKMYRNWEEVQKCMSSMEMELCDFLKKKQGKLGLREFDSLDYALGQMECRFQDFDQAIDKRRREE